MGVQMRTNRDETLLFRWVGHHIEGQLRSTTKFPKLDENCRKRYLTVLRNSLDDNKGLYAKIFDDDYLGSRLSKGERNSKTWLSQHANQLIGVVRPGLSFTELPLGETREHWRRYGRLAFGFTKQFITNQGGGPVHYTLGTSSSAMFKQLRVVQNALQEEDDEVLDAFEYVTHFFKRLRQAHKPHKRRIGTHAAQGGQTAQRSTGIHRAGGERYPKLQPMEFLNENEWRLVYNAKDKKHWLPIGSEPVHKAWFHATLGEEMQVIILPDNRTMQYVLHSPYYTNRLFARGRPPVQLISLEAVVRL